MPLGIFAEIKYTIGSAKTFEVGDVMLMTTDGVWEVRNKAGEMYGKERMKNYFKSITSKAPEDLLEAIHQEVIHFVGENDFLDDVTMVAIKRVN